MSTSIGAVTTLSTAGRNAMIAALGTLIDGGAGAATFRLRNSTTVLVTWTLSNPNPYGSAGSPGAGDIALAGTPKTNTASAGTNTVPNNFQILDGDGTVVIDGTVTSTDGITAGQTCNLTAHTLNMPAS